MSLCKLPPVHGPMGKKKKKKKNEEGHPLPPWQQKLQQHSLCVGPERPSLLWNTAISLSLHPGRWTGRASAVAKKQWQPLILPPAGALSLTKQWKIEKMGEVREPGRINRQFVACFSQNDTLLYHSVKTMFPDLSTCCYKPRYSHAHEFKFYIWKPFYILVQKQFFIVRYFCFHINKHVLTQEETSFSFSIFKGLKTLRDISVGSNLSKDALKLIKNWQSELLYCHKNILNKCCYI